MSASRHIAGGGLEGTVDGRVVRIGSPRFVRESVVSVDPTIGRVMDDLDRTLTPVHIAIDGVLVAIAGLGDRVRDDALGRLASGARRDLVTASNEAIELLGAMADAWDSRPEAGPRGRPLVDGGQGEDDGDGDGDDALVEVDSAAPPRRSSRSDRQAHEEPGGEGDELIEVDENGNPVEEGQA